MDYPHNRHTLAKWVKEYETTGTLKKKYHRQYKYSKEQKIEDLNHYLKHGKNMSYTCKKLGFPNRHDLKEWIDDFAPNERKLHKVSNTVINYIL